MSELNLEKLVANYIAPQVADLIKLGELKGANEYIRSIIQQESPTLEITVKDTPQKIKFDKVHAKFQETLRHIQTGEPVFLTGPAGSGKSTIAEQAATALSMDFSSISVCAQTTKSDFLGYLDAHGKYVSTLFRKIYEHGGIFLIDEIDAGNPNVLAVLNAALSGSQFAFPDLMVKKHANFLLIATANTVGKGSTEYIGRNQLDAATLDRFNFIHVNYDKKLENILVPKKHADVLMCIYKIRKIVTDGNIRIIVSTRSIIKIIKLLEGGFDLGDALESTIFKCVDNKARNDIMQKVGNM